MESGNQLSSMSITGYKGLVPVKRGTCAACMHPEQNEYLRMVYDGKMSNVKAAEALGVSSQVWYGHLKYCVKNAVESAIAPDIDGIAKRVIDHVDELIGQVDRVKGMVTKVYKVLEVEDDVDPKKLQSYIMVERQLTTTIELLAKMTGELNNSAIVNTTNIKIEFDDFKGKIMEILCPNCLDKLAMIDKQDISTIKNENIIKVEK